MDQDPHNGVGPGGVGKITVHKCFVNSTEVVLASTSPRSATEITCNQVNFSINHNGTKREDELCSDTAIIVVDVQGK